MEYSLKTPLNGNIVMTSCFHENKSWLSDPALYKFIWVREGTLTVEVDHVMTVLEKDEIIALTPLQIIRMIKVDGVYISLLFNSNFYCIFGHDNEVSCNGLLFNGSSHVLRIRLTSEESHRLHVISDIFRDECVIRDNLQEEMLRIVLKRFIITCTRIARDRLGITQDKEKRFDLIRQFYVLVDSYYKEKKQVKDYAELLHRSPKTISNLFAEYHLPSPLHVIHDRIDSEAKRLLLYTNKSGKEISDILGFEDLSSFSRFFKKMNKISFSEYRKKECWDKLPNTKEK
ncbi:MAG: helix-turn-helix domain-containing protein [Bacteroidales bacterium]